MKNKTKRISKIQNNDIPRIILIHKECIAKTSANYYADEVINEWLEQITEENVKDQLDNSTWEKLIVNDEIIGFCQYDLEEQELYQIQILPKYQGKGYGKFLYKHMENEFLKNENKKVLLFSTLNAKKFYENMGFEIIKKMKFPLDNTKLEMYEMRKDLFRS